MAKQHLISLDFWIQIIEAIHFHKVSDVMHYNDSEDTNTYWLQSWGCETIRLMNSCNPALLCLMNSIEEMHILFKKYNHTVGKQHASSKKMHCSFNIRYWDLTSVNTYRGQNCPQISSWQEFSSS